MIADGIKAAVEFSEAFQVIGLAILLAIGLFVLTGRVYARRNRWL